MDFYIIAYIATFILLVSLSIFKFDLMGNCFVGDHGLDLNDKFYVSFIITVLSICLSFVWFITVPVLLSTTVIYFIVTKVIKR